MSDNGAKIPPSTPQQALWWRLIVGGLMFAISIFLLAGLPQSLFDMTDVTNEARRWGVVITGSLGLVALFSLIFDINIRAATSIPGLSDSSAEAVGATALLLLLVLGGVIFFPELEDDGEIDAQIDRAIVRAMQALTLEEALLNEMQPVQIVAEIVTGDDPGRETTELRRNRPTDGRWVLIEEPTDTSIVGPIPVRAQDRIRRVYYFDSETLQRHASNHEPLRSTDALFMSFAELRTNTGEAQLVMMLYLNEARLTEALNPNQLLEGQVVPPGEIGLATERE